VLLCVAVVVTSLISIPYFAITPGTALDVSGLITLPRANSHGHLGSIFLTDVELVSLRAIQYPFFELNSDDQVVSAAELTGPANTTQYQEQGVIDMATARQAATVVALKTAGYDVSAVPDGVVDYQPISGSPAARALIVGDVISAIDSAPTLSFAELQAAVKAHVPGTRITVTYHFIGSSKKKTVSLVLGEATGTKGSSLESGCVPVGATHAGVVITVAGKPSSCIGLALEQIYRTTGAPFPVSIDSAGIIGPSAGLAFTLGLLAKLDPADLTGGKRVAATGTMSIAGDVGDVGGVAQKTVAVRDAGAVLFLVPPQELAVAKAHAGPTLKVVAVSTIGQAVAALRSIGGHLVVTSTK
jgi:PDZ domain-containing protein